VLVKRFMIVYTVRVVLKGPVPEREPLDPTSYPKGSRVEDSITHK